MMKEAPRDNLVCEQTVLHRAGAIQHGAGLIVIDPSTQMLVACNEKLNKAYSNPQNLGDVFLPNDHRTITKELRSGKLGEPRFLQLRDGEFVWASMFEADQYVGIDLTYVDEDEALDENANYFFAKCVQELTSAHESATTSDSYDAPRYFDAHAQGVQNLTGFDRTMIYRFDPDWNGEVIAEARSDAEIPSYLGLRFPSGDIPKPARDLFQLNKVRQVMEVTAPLEPVVSTAREDTPFVVNQSRSAFRYTSPVHLEYLTNMGVKATLAIAIFVRQRLWGLISCHHLSGRMRVPPQKLTLCHVLSDLASNHVARLLDRQRSLADTSAQDLLRKVSQAAEHAETPDELAQIVTDNRAGFLRLLKADGMQFESETTNWILGDVPPAECLTPIDQAAKTWRDIHGRSYIATSDLHRFCTELPPAALAFGGVLHAASWDNKMRFKVFRNAICQRQIWAGNPNAKSDDLDLASDAMHPRNSFAAYLEKTKGCSEVWDEGVLQASRSLQSGLRNIEMSFHKALRERQLRQSNAEMRNALVSANHEAHHDELTGVENRRGFEKRLAGLLPRAQRQNAMWLCHIDVDHFKRINDTFGHLAGDAVLKHIADLLQVAARGKGQVARIGGDEFALIMPGEYSDEDIQDLCWGFNERLREPLFVGGAEITVSCTLGVTSFDIGQEDSGDILARSDMALYAGKARGRGVCEFFSPDMEDESKNRRHLEEQIETALACNEFVPYFQPQVDAQTQSVVGYEVLARWQHPTRGILAPCTFLDTAERMGAIGEIDRAMLRNALDLQLGWRTQHGGLVPISVNVSFDRLQSKELINDLHKIGDRAKYVTLELLESIDLDDGDMQISETLDDLRKTGVGIEIDDFGAGRTSILAVLKVQPDRFKIDKRLIDPIANDKAARNIVKSVIGIGQTLGIQALAEGVETEEQVKILSELDCDRIQGFYFGKPQPAANVERTHFAAA
ncbi:diguanylate cyclase (GGDEF)-like protein [Yoonia maricola]|uniref:Diguanylate cyclase (GGDEF)-like protein n=1 Tax=Yoonia maricola TaxID=420999 RepID=A0A2M8W5M8_9RHOB|nr:EAL domain-containing protein [Yoonia maricola]PJI86226.1 diguanylate cyclase (GGDEF)-like protein [Yoonia maricola]